MNRAFKFLLLAMLVFWSMKAYADSDISLFEKNGQPVAYIAVDDGMTIYAWNGQPLAYIDAANVYGFNGRHLGWYKNGVIWDHLGHIACATKSTMQFTRFEPFKPYKKTQPLRALQLIAPLQPPLRNSWALFTCLFFLSGSVNN